MALVAVDDAAAPSVEELTAVEDVPHMCVSFSPKCAECLWQKFAVRGSWPAIFRHTVNGGHSKAGQSADPICAQGTGSTFRLGCQICASHVTKDKLITCPWAGFKIRSWSMVSRSAIQRHLNSTPHRDAACAYFGCGQEHLFGESSHVGDVPQSMNFVWAAGTVQTNSTYRDFAAFCELRKVDMSVVHTSALADRSRDACKKMVWSLAQTERAKEIAFFQRCCRFAYAQDDSDQVMNLRYRALKCFPVIEVKDGFGDIVRNHGHSSDECAAATVSCIQRMCVVAVGLRDAGKLTSKDDYVDPAAWGTIRQSLFQGCTDGAKVELDGVQLLRTANGSLEGHCMSIGAS